MGVSRPLISGRSFLVSAHVWSTQHQMPGKIQCEQCGDSRFGGAGFGGAGLVVLVSVMLVLVRLTKQQIAVNIITQA